MKSYSENNPIKNQARKSKKGKTVVKRNVVRSELKF